MQVLMVTGLFAGQHNAKLHGTITGIYISIILSRCYFKLSLCLLFAPCTILTNVHLNINVGLL